MTEFTFHDLSSTLVRDNLVLTHIHRICKFDLCLLITSDTWKGSHEVYHEIIHSKTFNNYFSISVIILFMIYVGTKEYRNNQLNTVSQKKSNQCSTLIMVFKVLISCAQFFFSKSCAQFRPERDQIAKLHGKKFFRKKFLLAQQMRLEISAGVLGDSFCLSRHFVEINTILRSLSRSGLN